MTMRKAFEEWAKQSGEFTDWSRDKTSEANPYHKPRVELAWQAWQAAAKAGWLTLDKAPLNTHGYLYSPEVGLAGRTDISGTVIESQYGGRRGVSSSTRGFEFTHWHPLLDPPKA